MYGPSIAKEYAKGWMVLDILASIPLDLIVLGTSRCVAGSLVSCECTNHASFVYGTLSTMSGLSCCTYTC